MRTSHEYCECGDSIEAHDVLNPGTPSEERRCHGLQGECSCSSFRLVVLGLYKHFKGKTYRLNRLMRDSENTERILASYWNENGDEWCRPLRGEGCGFLDELPSGEQRFTKI